MNILNYNVCGIDSKLSNAEFVNFISQYDIACLSETFLTKDLDTSMFKDHVEYASKAMYIISVYSSLC